jgi:lactoylglutathione lyase
MSDVTDAQSSTWPANVFAVTLFVEDLAAAREFYMDTFDLPIDYQDEVSAVFKFPNILINLLAISEAPGLIAPAPVAPYESGARAQFTINVPDVDGLVARLKGKGVAILNGPIDRPWGIRTATFRDPGGHIWEIAQ